MQLLFYGVLPPGLVRYCLQYSCVVAAKLFYHPYSSIDTTTTWKKLRFILLVRPDFHMTDSLLMPLLVACWCLSQLMRHCFQGKWNCLLVSESYHFTWICRLFDYSTCIPFCVHWHGGLCCCCSFKTMFSAWASAFARSAISLAYSASVIVCAGYFLLLSFVSLKLFSFILSIDVLRTLSRQMIKRYGANVSPCSTPATM